MVLLSSSIRPDLMVARASRRHLLSPSPKGQAAQYLSPYILVEIIDIILFERSTRPRKETRERVLVRDFGRASTSMTVCVCVCVFPRVRQTFAEPVSMIKLAINRGREGGIMSLFGGR